MIRVLGRDPIGIDQLFNDDPVGKLDREMLLIRTLISLNGGMWSSYGIALSSRGFPNRSLRNDLIRMSCGRKWSDQQEFAYPMAPINGSKNLGHGFAIRILIWGI